MREPETKIEWLFINLRWLFLTAVAGVIGVEAVLNNTPLPISVVILLIIGVATNILAMISLFQSSLSKFTRTFTLIGDIALTLGFIAGSGGTQSPLLFFTLIPIITAALRYTWFIGMLFAIAIVMAYWGIAWYLDLSQVIPPPLPQIFPYLTTGIVLLFAGGAVSLISARIKQTLKVEQQRRKAETEAALTSAHQRVRLIFELASTLSATLNYERVLETALDVSNAGLREILSRDVKQVGMILLFGMDQTLYVAKSRGLSNMDEQRRFPAQQGILAKAITQVDPVVVEEPGQDPELGQVIATHNTRQAIVIPLRAGFESYGLLVLCSYESETYTHDFQDLLVAVCNQAVMALQNASLYQNLMEEKERLVEVEETERKKLARDLHDGPTQTIAAIAMRLNYIRLLLERDPGKAVEELSQLEELARKTTKEIRQMLFILRPLILETQGLAPAVEQLVQKITETNPLPIHMEIDSVAAKLMSKEAQGAVFHIIEEGLNNVRKYAQANDVWIRIYPKGTNVIAEVEDNGSGFDIAKTEASYDERGSLGLKNLRERAILVKGKTVIQSEPGKGTKITVTVPVDRKQLLTPS
ncbi:MAG: GAF domain-containing protein [Anaerolineae bacterium]|nr:GAF domain-containing protein [Anaerolineae bacterium]